MAGTKTGIWKEREFVDLWSLVHFLTCFAFSGVMLYFKITPYIAGGVAVLLFCGWEILELFSKIHEKAANRVSDVLVDYCGFFLAQIYVFAWHGTMYWYIPVIIGSLALGLQIWGVIDYKTRKH